MEKQFATAVPLHCVIFAVRFHKTKCLLMHIKRVHTFCYKECVCASTFLFSVKCVWIHFAYTDIVYLRWCMCSQAGAGLGAAHAYLYVLEHPPVAFWARVRVLLPPHLISPR